MNSLGDDDIQVYFPRGYVASTTLVDKSTTANAASVTAVYRVNIDPGGWLGTERDYQIYIRENTVSDGNGVTVPMGKIGSFDVFAKTLLTDPSRFQSHNVRLTLNEADSVFAGDLDGDGDIDMATSSPDGHPRVSNIYWYRNDGSEDFEAIPISESLLRGRSITGVDLDGDTDIDLLAIDSNGSPTGNIIVWYENDGVGGFAEQDIISSRGLNAFHAADLDGDGDVDLASTAYYRTSAGAFPEVAWYRNEGNMFFSRHSLPASDVPRSIISDDLNGDGHLDLIVNSTDAVSWYENDGQGEFTARVLSTSSRDTRDIHTSDINGDGHVDLILAGDAIRWYENDGNSRFTERVLSDRNLRLVSSVNSGDLDNDGDVDIVFTSGDDVRWYENDGSERFTHRYAKRSEGGHQVQVLDVNEDGHLDIISAGPYFYAFAWHENLAPVPVTPSNDTEPPTAVASTGELTGEFTSQIVHLTVKDNGEVDLSSLGPDNLEIRGPGDTVIRDFTHFHTPSQPGSSSAQAFLTASVPITAPNGTYSIFLLEDQIRDTGDNPAPAGVIGEFLVNRPTGERLEADANGDLRVDFADFLVLSRNFGNDGDESKGDFNNDGTVDFTDFLLLTANFGRRL